MTASELSRQLLFYGYTEVTDYLKNSPLNRYLYKKFLTLLPKYGIDIPIVDMFNEIYYQCVHVNYDGMPGIDVEQRYVVEAESWLQSKAAAEMVFAVTYAVLDSKQEKTFEEECFLSQMDPYIHSIGFKVLTQTIYKELRYLGAIVPDTFPTLTIPIDNVPRFEEVKDRNRSLDDMIHASVEKNLGLEKQYFEKHSHAEVWRMVTCNFTHSIIEKLAQLYTNPGDQIELIDRMVRVLSKDDLNKHGAFFKDLDGRIKTGNFGPNNYEFHYNQAFLDRLSEDEPKDIVDDLKQEIDDLKNRIEEQRKSYEMEMAKKEAQYQIELDKIRKERNKLAHDPVARQEAAQTSAPVEMTLTLTEMADYVKSRFSNSGANEICTMFYSKAIEHHYLDEDTSKIIDSIVPDIIQRDKPQQNINIPQASQVNINPQTVQNHFKEEKDK